MLSKECAGCSKTFFKNKKTGPEYFKEKTKYCSRACSDKKTLFKGGHSKGVRFKRGQRPWNKDTKGVMKANSGSFKKGGGGRKAEDCPTWKGEEVGYNGLHAWCNNNFERTGYCEHCLITEQEYVEKGGRKLDLSNNGIYNRIRENWEFLCRSCHIKKDKGLKTIYEN